MTRSHGRPNNFPPRATLAALHGVLVAETIATRATCFSYPASCNTRVRTNSTNGQRMVNAAATLESYIKAA